MFTKTHKSRINNKLKKININYNTYIKGKPQMIKNAELEIEIYEIFDIEKIGLLGNNIDNYINFL